MLKKIKNKKKQDKGAAVTILGLSMIIITLMLAIFIVDFMKITYIKGLYNDYALTATKVAIKQQDSIGGLTAKSADKVVDEYIKQRNGIEGSLETNAYRGNCDNGKYPKIEITYDNSRRVGSKSPVYTSVAGSIPNISNRERFYENQYTVIQIKVTDVVDNHYMGIFGIPCAEITSNASAMGSRHFDDEEK